MLSVYNMEQQAWTTHVKLPQLKHQKVHTVYKLMQRQKLIIYILFTDGSFLNLEANPQSNEYIR